MPIIHVEWYPGKTREVKEKVAAALTKVMVEVANSPADHTYIVFHDEPKENWATGGKLNG
jgi:4-oxalocrotonate tautomerase